MSGTYGDVLPIQLVCMPDPIDEAFRHFIHRNPRIVHRVIALAFELQNAGNDTASMETIFGKLRWDEKFKANGEQFAINDHYSSRMSRLVMQLEPDLDGFFNTRVLRADRERVW
jgi:hypothetical protein